MKTFATNIFVLFTSWIILSLSLSLTFSERNYFVVASTVATENESSTTVAEPEIDDPPAENGEVEEDEHTTVNEEEEIGEESTDLDDSDDDASPVPDTAETNTEKSDDDFIDLDETVDSEIEMEETDSIDSNTEETVDEEEMVVENDDTEKEDSTTDEIETNDTEEDIQPSDAKNEESESKENESEPIGEEEGEEEEVKQTGPLVDILGDTLLSLDMIDAEHAQLKSHLTNDALKGKKVIGLYFSADWCGPCRQFTPELVSFYDKMNARRGKKDQFEIVWISRCRDFNAFGQYFTHMKWLAMQPELAMGEWGQKLSDKYKVKGIPTLVLLDEDGNIITTDGRNKIPADRAGIGFPWRNPFASVYLTLFPKPLRFWIKSSLNNVKRKVLLTVKGALGMKAVA